MLKNLVAEVARKIEQELKKLPRKYLRTVNHVITIRSPWTEVRSSLCR